MSADDSFQIAYGVAFTGLWKNRTKGLGKTAVKDIAASLLNAYNDHCNKLASMGEACAGTFTAESIFKATYGSSSVNPIKLQWVNSACAINGNTCYADAYQYPDTIRVYEYYYTDQVDANGNSITARTPVTPALLVHELGHAFNVRAGRGPEDYVGKYINRDGDHVLTENRNGFVTGFTFGQDNSSSEIFADMFVGWVYGAWADNQAGQTRNTVMTTNMIFWLTVAQNGP